MPMKDKFLKEKKSHSLKQIFLCVSSIVLSTFKLFSWTEPQSHLTEKSLWRKVNRFFVLFVLKNDLRLFFYGAWKEGSGQTVCTVTVGI